MKKILLVLLSFVLLISIVGCGNSKNKVDTTVSTDGTPIEDDLTVFVDEEKEVLEEFEDLVGNFELPFENEISFYAGREDGSQSNSIILGQDGSFHGNYYELNKELIGENYQNGTYYWNEYWGEFTDILWLDEYTFSMKMTYLATSQDEGMERLEDDSFKSVTTLNFPGISKDVEYVMFMPNTPVHMLPENLDKLINKDLSNQDSLGVYVLYNVEEHIAFYSET